MRAYGKNCLTTHAPFGALNSSFRHTPSLLHPLDVVQPTMHSRPLQKRLRGELGGVRIGRIRHLCGALAKNWPRYIS